MSNSSVSIYSSEIEEEFTEHKQLMWKSFTPERVSYLTREINRAYTPGVGIQASDLCRILYGYYPARKVYEGIAYHIFDLVATKDGSGHIYFIKKSDIGSSSFPVISSIWHNLDLVVEEENSSEEDTISSARDSLENSWSENSSSVSKSELSTVLSEMLTVCSKLSKVLSTL